MSARSIRWLGVLVLSIMLFGCAEMAGTPRQAPTATDPPTVNDPLVAEAGDDQLVRPGATVTVTGSSGTVPNDNDGGRLSFAWTPLSAAPAGAPPLKLSSVDGPTITFTVPDRSTVAAYLLQLTVTDPAGARATDTVKITVSDRIPGPAMRQTTRGIGTVNVSVYDAEGFAAGDHGARVTATFDAHTKQASLVQYWPSHVRGNGEGYTSHVVRHNDGVFWTATDQNPFYIPGDERLDDVPIPIHWFIENGRPFTAYARDFANWMSHQNVLFVSSLENPTAAKAPDGMRVAVYCDDLPDISVSFFPRCGELDDYIAHSGIGIENAVFAGYIQGFAANSSIRSDGVFAGNAIYAPASSTSHAAAVVGAIATNIAAELTVTYGRLPTAKEIKAELFKRAALKEMTHFAGASNAAGTVITEKRCLRVIGLTESRLSSLPSCSQ